VTQDGKKSKRDAEDWLTAIEYLWTRNNYELFANRYGEFKFSLDQTNEESEKVVQASGVDDLAKMLKEKSNKQKQLKNSSILNSETSKMLAHQQT
jgi:hypothetical protein